MTIINNQRSFKRVIFALANNHGICLSLLIRLYFNSVQFINAYTHEFCKKIFFIYADAHILNSRICKGGQIIEVKKNYKVYMHTNLTTLKKYCGITKMKPETRWNNGLGYKSNKKFYSDVKKYGWDGFSHEILYDNLDYLQARTIETKIIKELNLIKDGYNQSGSTLTDSTLFDFYSFASLDIPEADYKNKVKYFTRIPNIFIQNNISKIFGLNRIFLVVYILIDRNRNYEDKSYITIGQVFRTCGYKISRNKPKVYYEIIKSLLFLKENHFINTTFDIYTVGYENCIEIEIITENFDITSNFTKIYGKDFDTIMMADSSLNRENILVAFLYINSYIGCRPKQNDGSEYENAEDNPEAFYRSIKHMAEELSMSKDTINQCIEFLTKSSDDIPALLVKREVGSVQPNKSKPPQNVPNIYVLNKEGYKQEIEWALSKMLELYKVDEFYPPKSGNYRFQM